MEYNLIHKTYTENECWLDSTKEELEEILKISDFIVLDYGTMISSKQIEIREAYRGLMLGWKGELTYTWLYNLAGYYVKEK